MSADRSASLAPRQKQHKKLARELIEAVGGVEAAASFCRAGKSQLSDYANVNVIAFMPSDVIEDLERVSAPGFTRYLAAAAGFVLVAKSPPLADEAEWCAAIGDAVAEFSDVQERLIKALPGGVTADELRAADIRTQIREAMERLAHLDALAAAALGEP